ncbi:MAG: hypothetical protein A2096_04640 [Spirochaetes bacterium GWF1_41_5]|nr:MAG: hypothetical protein A2096_04640 [Spirochaetes bacterium GWF1_41_5]
MKKYAGDAGKEAENEACLFLQKHGYHIHARNYRYGHYEIDIIAGCSSMLAFVEIKSRRWSKRLYKYPLVPQAKRKRIISASEHFLREHPEFSACFCRYDVILILNKMPGLKIEHYKGAFSIC